MTERWSGVFLESRRKRLRQRGGSRRRTPRGLPQALGGQSPKMVFAAGARDVNVSCRNELEASRRCARGMPQGKRCPMPSGSNISDESHSQATEKAAGLDEVKSHSPSAKVHGWARSGSAKAFTLRAWAREGRKIGAAPRL